MRNIFRSGPLRSLRAQSGQQSFCLLAPVAWASFLRHLRPFWCALASRGSPAHECPKLSFSTREFWPLLLYGAAADGLLHCCFPREALGLSAASVLLGQLNESLELSSSSVALGWLNGESEPSVPSVALVSRSESSVASRRRTIMSWNDRTGDCPAG